MSDYHSAEGIRDAVRLTALFSPQNRDKPPREAVESETDDAGKKKSSVRVLVVEDEFLLSSLLIQDLRAAGYDIAGPCPNLAAAMLAVQTEEFDAAILDINLKGELVYPVAERLTERRIPFLFLSGYATSNIPEKFRALPRLAKPAPAASILQMITRVLGKQGP